LLKNYTYLTRMYTTISPAEMTEDPTFEEKDGLPNVVATQFATQRTRCDNKSGVILPDGREVGLSPVANPSSPSATTFNWPKFTAEMPWVERIEDLASATTASDGGAVPVVLVDNHDKIDELLKAWNDSVGWVPQGLDAGGTTGGPLAEGGLGTGGASADSGTGLMVSGDSGCACDVPGRTTRGGFSLGPAVALALLIQRRRTKTASS
jgi:hypothetical protein